jgi:hypothetical protein
MTPVVEAMHRCDGLLLASPVYMGLVTRADEGDDGPKRGAARQPQRAV